MKKFFSLLIIAALTVLGVSAKGDLRNAMMLNANLQPATMTVAKAQAKKLSALRHKTVSVDKAGLKVKKAPANDVNLDEWNYLGEGKYGDGLVYKVEMQGYATEAYSYAVPVYQSKTDENKYLFYDIYPASYLSMTNYFSQTDDKPSTATFTVDGSSVTLEFDTNLTFYSSFEVALEAKKAGTFRNGVFSFEAGAAVLSIPAMDESEEGFAFTASLPDGEQGGGDDDDDQSLNMDDWTLLGEAEYTDGIIYASWGANTELDKYKLPPYKVLSYRNKKNGCQFLLTNVFPEDVLSNLNGYYSFELVGGKESNLILTVDPETKKVKAEYLNTLAFTDEDINTIEIEQRGTNGDGVFDNGTVTFGFNAFLIKSLGGSHQSQPITIVFPEGTELIEGGTPDDPVTGDVDLTKWTSLGKAQYTDGFLYAAYSVTTPFPAYEVDAYVSKTNENQYMLYDIYPTSYLNEEEIYAQTDGKPSTVIFTVNPEDNSVEADFDLYLTDTSDGSAFTVTPDEPGKYNGGNIIFGEGAFYCNYDGQAYAWSLAFDVKLPGAKDYSFSVASMSDLCNADNKWSFAFAAGTDVAAIKYGIFSGIFSASEGNLGYVGENGSTIEEGAYNYQFKAEDAAGYYTLVAAALDADGNVVGGGAIYFYVNHDLNPEEWVSLGKVDFTDDTFEPLFFRNPTYPTYKVELLENKATPGMLCMVNPYKNMPTYGVMFEGHSDCNHYITIDATTSTYVEIPTVPMGVNLGDGDDLSLESGRPGTISEGHLTFPTRGLIVYKANLDGYYANQSGEFNLEVPNLVKVTATVDGKPVEGAIVTFEDWSVEGVTTDAEGVAYFPYPATATQKIVVYKDGYEMFELPEAVKRYSEETVELVAAKATLTVIVSDEEGEPVADAWVYFQDKEVQTGENGQVVITDISAPAVLGQEIDFSVYKDGYEPLEAKANFTEGFDAYAPVTLQAAKATLTVIVTDEADEPVADAWVYFQDKEVQTGDNGQVVITDLHGPSVIGKEIDFTVYKDGYEPVEAKANFTEGIDAYAPVTLKAAKATLTVIALDKETYEPIADATVKFLEKEYTTGDNGQVVITDINALEVLGHEVDITIEHTLYTTYTGKADFTESIDAYVTAEMTKSMSGIDAIMRDINNGNTEVYDLNGRRVVRPAAGNVYIVNGVKVLVK
ncbi:MAG: carboxypeptidase-like regulatory domain-containing protein [Duncaniella sp.]|nr:carboxypeptidase-like regulatory domain-containing protein [Duncaniella sp.]